MCTKFTLKKFDPNIAKLNSVLIIGKRAVGKTVMAKHLLSYMDISNKTIISPTFDICKDYQNTLLPKDCIFTEYSESIVNDFMRIQTEKLENLSDSRACIVFDCCMYDDEWINHKPIKELYRKGENMNINKILIMQYATKLPGTITHDIDYTIVCKESNPINLRRIYKMYAAVFPTFNTFIQVMEHINSNPYDCLVIHNKAQSLKFEDNVMWYTSPKP